MVFCLELINIRLGFQMFAELIMETELDKCAAMIETWLSDGDCIELVEIQGYTLIRIERSTEH